jgi:hypothetical protein
MKEDDHPDHNMPAPEHDGTILPTEAQRSEGLQKLKGLMKSSAAKDMMESGAMASNSVSYLARGK